MSETWKVVTMLWGGVGVQDFNSRESHLEELLNQAGISAIDAVLPVTIARGQPGYTDDIELVVIGRGPAVTEEGKT